MNEKQEREIKMFGETIETMKQMAYSIDFEKPDPLFLVMHGMAILSDVQHIMAEQVYGADTNETARQWINKAKWFMSEATYQLHPANKVSIERDGVFSDGKG